jgi:hypothetical protein
MFTYRCNAEERGINLIIWREIPLSLFSNSKWRKEKFLKLISNLGFGNHLVSTKMEMSWTRAKLSVEIVELQCHIQVSNY